MHVLDTERLRLRWFSTEDAAFMLELLNQPAWIEHIGDRGVRTVEDARAYIEARLLSGYREHGLGFWAVERRDDGVLVGGCGLIQRPTYVDVGYGFLPRFWGHGYAREAAAACLVCAERALGLNRVLAIIAPANAPSIAVARALGMRLQETRVLDGEEEPVHVFAWGRPADVAPPGDEAQIDTRARCFFAAFTNRDGAIPAVWAIPSFFLSRAVITKIDGAEVEVFDVQGFVTPRAALLTGGRLTGFAEHEIESHTDLMGDIAQRRCRYRKAGVLDGLPFEGEGVKTMQLVRTPQGWKIAALAWQDTR
jgi:RimJ/RimL family protein N-acetyltransferase